MIHALFSILVGALPIGDSDDDGPSCMPPPILERPRAYNPSSRTAHAITGPVILSRSHIVFGEGARAGLEPIRSRCSAAFSDGGRAVHAQIFALTADPGPLSNDNRLCGGGRDAGYLVFYQRQIRGAFTLTMAAYGGGTPPEALSSPGFCGTYHFSMERPVRAVPGWAGENEDLAH